MNLPRKLVWSLASEQVAKSLDQKYVAVTKEDVLAVGDKNAVQEIATASDETCGVYHVTIIGV